MSTATKQPTAREIEAQMEADVRESAKDHVATLSEDGKRLRFAKVGTSCYSLNYRIEGGYLLVWGDMGDGVLASGLRTFAEWANTQLDYFHSKYHAFPRGQRDGMRFDGNLAFAEMKERWGDTDTWGEPHVPWSEIEEVWRWEHPTNHEEWMVWCGENGYKLFGPDWTECVSGIGYHRDYLIVAQHTLLRMAMEQLGEALHA